MNQHEISRNNSAFDQNLLVTLKNRKRGCDVEIIFNEERLQLHSIVLGENSQFFEMNLFGTPAVPGNIKLENVNTEATKTVIEYCYTGKIKLYEKDVLNVLIVADFLKIKSVIVDCSKILKTMIDSENCFNIRATAQKLHLIDLEESCLDWIRDNLTMISTTSNFLTLNLSDLITILKSVMTKRSDAEMFESIKKWINHDLAVRSEHLTSLLGYVRLEQLPIKTLTSNSQIMCKVDPHCFGLFLKAIEKSEKTCLKKFESYIKYTMVVIGAVNPSSTIEIYNSLSDSWTIKNVNKSRTMFQSIFYDEKIIILGGESGTALNTVECFDVKTWRKSTLAPMIESRYNFTATIVEDYIFVTGGYGSNNNVLKSSERYDLHKNEWQKIASMPSERYKHGAAFVNGNLYVVGGRNKGPMSVNESYSLSTEKWTTRTSMLEKREALAVAALKGLVYAVGGFNGSKFLSSVERYDPEIDKWTHVRPFSKPAYGMTAVALDDHLIITGGDSIGKSVQQYDPDNNDWKTLPSMHEERYYHQTVLVPVYLLY